MENEELKIMFAEEERLLDESHQRTMERHEEIMEAIENAKSKRKSPLLLA